MKPNPIRALAGAAVLLLSAHAASAAVITFESVTLPASGYQNGSTAGSFAIGGAIFRNNYDPTYDSWSGFSFSNHTDKTSAGYLNQYSSFAGSGAGGSTNFAVGYFSSYETSTNVTFSSPMSMAGLGASVTNTTYGALSMATGDGYAKKFGGSTGNDPDWLLLTIRGYSGGLATGSVNFYLADYRFGDNALDTIVNDWRFVDFSALGTVDEIRFSMSSSDNDPLYGMKTPSYFALDNFLAVPEPSSLLVAITGLGLVAVGRKR